MEDLIISNPKLLPYSEGDDGKRWWRKALEQRRELLKRSWTWKSDLQEDEGHFCGARKCVRWALAAYSRGALVGKWSTLLRDVFGPHKEKVSELGPHKRHRNNIENAENSSLIYLVWCIYLIYLICVIMHLVQVKNSVHLVIKNI